VDDPVFLSLDEAIRIQQDQLIRYGGCGGTRDMGLLQSALAMPQAGFADRFAHEDLFAMAAAYLFHIVQNHPFVDGNKRAGITAALVFLVLNDYWVDAPEAELETLVWAVARGEVVKAGAAEFFRLHARPDDGGALDETLDLLSQPSVMEEIRSAEANLNAGMGLSAADVRAKYASIHEQDQPA
jgi:death on curing protein